MRIDRELAIREGEGSLGCLWMLVVQPAQDAQRQTIFRAAAQQRSHIENVEDLQFVHHALRLPQHVLETLRMVVSQVFQVPPDLSAQTLANRFHFAAITRQLPRYRRLAEEPLERG